MLTVPMIMGENYLHSLTRLKILATVNSFLACCPEILERQEGEEQYD